MGELLLAKARVLDGATGARSVVLEDPEPAHLTREEGRTVVEEAHRLGKRLAAHAFT